MQNAVVVAFFCNIFLAIEIRPFSYPGMARRPLTEAAPSLCMCGKGGAREQKEVPNAKAGRSSAVLDSKPGLSALCAPGLSCKHQQ